MTDGIFPSCTLKTGKITPIYKKDEQLLENYRLVSTLPIFGCLQDTLSSRARLAESAREKRYLAYKNFGKLFEKIISVRLYSFLTTNAQWVFSGVTFSKSKLIFCVKGRPLHKSQFGFRKGHSTSHALNYSIHQIQQALIQVNHVLGIFIDLRKAFDTITNIPQDSS